MANEGQTDEQLLKLLTDSTVLADLEERHASFQEAVKEGCTYSFLVRGYRPTTLFCDLVATRLQLPPSITPEELSDAFARHLLHQGDTPFDLGYERFYRDVRTESSFVRTSEPIATLTYDLDSGFDLSLATNHFLIDRGAGDFQAYISAVLPAGPTIHDDMQELWTAYVTLRGRFSPRALAEATAEFKDAVTSLLYTFMLIEEQSSSRAVLGHKAFSSHPELVKVAQARLAAQGKSFQPTHPLEHLDETLVSAESRLPMYLAQISELLEAHYSAPTTKDSIASRIRNAIHLLIQADKQAKHAIGLALSVAAIEAMLCRKDSGLTTMFADNVAALLEPKPEYRAQASAFAAKLYGWRSSVLHGAVTEIPATDLHHARLLAAAVLKAFNERRQFRKRSGYEHDETPDDLLNEMKKDRFTAGQVFGVQKSDVVYLWRWQK